MSYFVKNSNLSSIQDIVNSFTQVITQQNALITALQSGLSTGDTNLTGLVARVAANEGTFGGLNTITTNNASAIGVLQSAATTTSNAITNNASAIANLNLNIIALVTTVSTFAAAITALEYKPPLPILHWDFNNFLDKVYGIPFANPFGIVLSNGSAVVDQTGPDQYLEATLPVDLLSKFSKTFMFKFKSYPGLDTVTDFVVSTYGFADPRYTTGFSIRIRNGEIVVPVTVSGLSLALPTQRKTSI